jgi:hypothetical protein
MISEQTPGISTHALRLQPFAETTLVVEAPDARSRGWRERLVVVGVKAEAVTMALLGALASGVRPSYFELERRGPTHQRLGPGLSRESDSFWPLAEC